MFIIVVSLAVAVYCDTCSSAVSWLLFQCPSGPSVMLDPHWILHRNADVDIRLLQYSTATSPSWISIRA